MPLLEAGIAAYLRRIQGAHGGWPLFRDGDFDMSATVKAYFALKMIGDEPQAAHMRRAREAIRMRGGAERANVFTRCLLALYGIVPWRAVPVMPVEIMLLPKWFPFHLDKISYWSRTVIVPLLVLMAKKPRARNAKGVTIDELFLDPPQSLGPTPKAPQQKAAWFWFFRAVDNVLRAAEPYFPKRTRQRAIDRAVAWVSERLNGEDGLGAIFPAMANSVMMYSTRSAIRRIIRSAPSPANRSRSSWSCTTTKPIASPACRRSGTPGSPAMRSWKSAASARWREVKRGLDWLMPMQVLDVRGDWIARRPDLRPGGWAFQYANPHYPDVDDTAVVAMAMDRMQGMRAARARRRITAPRSSARASGSSACRAATAAGARSMPTTNIIISTIFRSPITARCSIRRPRTSARAACRCWRSSATPKARPSSARIDYLRRTQLADGSWYGRWGMNYIYGTWSVLKRAQCRGVFSRRAGTAQGGGLARRDPERRRRLGRGRLKLQARLSRL